MEQIAKIGEYVKISPILAILPTLGNEHSKIDRKSESMRVPA